MLTSSNNAFERDPRRQQELAMRPLADALYKSVWTCEIIRNDHSSDAVLLDKYHAIDATLRFPNGMILTLQEKFLSAKYASFASLTIEYEQNQFTGEQGDWYKLAAQLYFVGYCTPDMSAFKPYALINWSQLVQATVAGQAIWHENKNKDGRARASFKYIRFMDIPKSCILARSYAR